MEMHERTTKEQLLKENKQLRTQISELEEFKNKIKPKKNKQIDTNEVWSSFMNSATEGFVILDSKLDFTEINEAGAAIFGLKRENFIGKNITEISPEAVNSGRYNKYLEVIKTGKPVFFEDLIIHPTFGNFHLNLKVFKIENGVGIIISDITEKKRAETKLKESEEKLQRSNKKHSAMIENIGDVIAIIGTDGMTKYQSPNVEKWFGWKPEELLGNGWDKMHPEDVGMIQQEFAKVLESEKPLKVEYRFRCKDGNYKWIKVTANNRYNDPAIGGVLINYHDITERREAENALKESEKKYRTLTDNMALGQVLHAADTSIVFANPTASQILGLSEDQMLGKNTIDPTWKFVRADESDMPHNEYPAKMVMATKKKLSEYIVGVIRPDRDYITWALVNAVPILNKDNNLEYVSITFSDITGIRKAEEILKERTRFFDKMFDITSLSTWVSDEKGIAIRANPACYKFFGAKEEEVIGIYNVFKDEVVEKQGKMAIVKMAYATGEPKSFILDYNFGEVDHVNVANAKYKYIQVNLTPIVDEKGKVTNVVSQSIDLTDIKEAEKELIKAKDKAEESDRLKSAFLANMSHEIRTPMNGILGFLELLKEPNLTEGQKDNYINIVNKGGARLLNTINDIIEISKIESKDIEIDKQSISINSLLMYYYDFFLPQTKSKQLEFKLINAPKLESVIVFSDKNKLDSILTNLIKNAIKFTKSGKIEFGCEFNEKELKFFVSDTGMGIKKERLEAVFDRFVQADINITKGYEGSGLGLSICKSFVGLLGGKIWVESKENIGSTFFFTIPIDSGKKKNEQKFFANKEYQKAPAKSSSEKKLKILIAEDDEVSSMYLKTLLETINCEILLGHTGDEVIHLCYNNPDTDIILMDIKMPDMSGYDATGKIRKFNKNVYIIAQTAFAFSEDESKAKQAGCDAYIAKPIKKNVLFDLIEKYMKTR